jgi:hypothetical protein
MMNITENQIVININFWLKNRRHSYLKKDPCNSYLKYKVIFAYQRFDAIFQVKKSNNFFKNGRFSLRQWLANLHMVISSMILTL